MKRIKLTKEEKKTLRIVDKFNGKCPCGFPLHVYNLSVRSLERKGLVKAAYLEGGAVEDARTTDEGKHYLCDNPNLRNPINWTVVGVIAGILSLIVSVIALFISCTAMYR